jgi:hypothetical protein
MTQVTGTPRSLPCQARAKAWLPADAVMTPDCLASGDNNIKLFLPPLFKNNHYMLKQSNIFNIKYLSLKLPVNCVNSFFK